MSTNNKQIQESCKTYFSSEITAWGVIRSGDPSCEQGLLGPAESMDRVETLLAPTDPLWKETPFLAYTYMFKSLCKRFRDKALWSDEVTRSLLMTINCNWHMVVRPKNAMSRRVIALYTSVVATCTVIKKTVGKELLNEMLTYHCPDNSACSSAILFPSSSKTWEQVKSGTDINNLIFLEAYQWLVTIKSLLASLRTWMTINAILTA